MSKKFWSFVWKLSEVLYIPLGKYAPFVFEKMIGVKGKKITKTYKGKSL